MDLPFAVSLAPASSRSNHTGTWRTDRPVYIDAWPPCNAACPADESVQGWLYHAAAGDWEIAWRQLVAVNPFPAVMGRVCYHPCEARCNRREFDEAVAINAVEQFLGDEALRRGWRLPSPGAPTGHRVLIVGAGPAGLAAAYHLRLLGHEVELHDAEAEPGGMMRYAIPTFRLSRRVLDAEIERVLELGIHYHPRSRISDLSAVSGYDAIFVAVGAQHPHRVQLPADPAARILDALDLLRRTAQGERPGLGRRVAVYGGGNTAMDAARTAKRLGADEVVVVYRRTRERMPAHDTEVAEAVEEGVVFEWLSTVTHVGPGSLRLERMELDAAGKPRPTGRFVSRPADTLILALGQEVDAGLLRALPGVHCADGGVVVDASLMTGAAGVFAGGDMIPGERTVTAAIGHGRRAAFSIDAWLRGRQPPSEPLRESADFASLNTWYYDESPAAQRSRLPRARRLGGFGEVVRGLDPVHALAEARRCFSCGNCFQCDNCYAVCPDAAVLKVESGHGYAIDLDYCKGCGLCVAECPVGAIRMVSEPCTEVDA